MIILRFGLQHKAYKLEYLLDISVFHSVGYIETLKGNFSLREAEQNLALDGN